MNKRLEIQICGVTFQNPVITASGTFGSGREYGEYFDLNCLGGITVKGVSALPWTGNPPPRIAETYGGMLNSVGLQNPGVNAFMQNDIPYLSGLDTNIIVNVCGHTVEEYVSVVKALRGQPFQMLELNISCPNVREGGMAFGTDPKMVEQVVAEVKKVADKPLIVKLSPNVTDIAEIAKAAEAAGADALSLINTLLGMRIDIHKRRPVLANQVGGLSGPAVKPVAVRMVNQVAHGVTIPVIGMGGITTGEDAIEFLMAGASLVAVGTAHFQNPLASMEILAGIENFMDGESISDIQQIIGVI